MNEDLSKIALDVNRDGVWDWDISTGKSYVSKRWKEILGYEDESFSNRQADFEKLIHPDDKQRTLDALIKHFKGETPYYENELRLLCKDGSYKWILDRGQVCARSADGKAERMVGAQTDFSEHVAARERMRGLELMFTTSLDMLAELDSDFTYLMANEAYCDAFGLKNTDLIGQTVANVFGDEFFETVIKPNASKTFKGQSIRYRDWFDFPAAGKKYMDVAYTPRLSQSGQWQGLLVSARDITPWQKQQS